MVYQETDKYTIDNFRKECQDAVEMAKQTYISNLGNKLTNHKTSETSYWRILNKVINKCKVPKIPLYLQSPRKKEHYLPNSFPDNAHLCEITVFCPYFHILQMKCLLIYD